ncbi:S8 family serine peptidase [Jejudonia soesokkakensis]|uniref:S8 family serine peptidase n=1 Tax=Jejudonia soesokkakensis TaxID=1323432 RepID=A0ABW2MMY7_9FLAO
MKKITSTLKNAFLFVAFLLIATASFGQNDYTIRFQNEAIEIPENIHAFELNEMPESARLAGGTYSWIQFYETPTQNIQNSFKANNIELIDYIPHKAYLAYIPNGVNESFLRNNNVRGIIPVPASVKLSEALQNGDYPEYATEGSKILVTLTFYDKVSSDFVINDLTTKQISLKQQFKSATVLELAIPDNCLEELSNLPYVKNIELITAPDVKDDTEGRSLHRSSGLDTQTSAGRNYTGEGIGVMVRDDGIVGPHIDYQGRIDNSGASGSGATHGDGVGGIMAGAGNLNPRNRGMAAGSDVYVVNYVSSFLDTPTLNLINSGDVQITNSSYSNGCNEGYTSIARRVDEQTNDIPSLLHVFSAGNSNNSNCGYGAGTQWGNITGGHKQGKNVIATANVFYEGSLVNSSSRGPAHDGRIKPDIAANGQNQISTAENNTYQSFGGTSGAAPGIAGVSAQLYEVYGDENSGALPPSALIKATLLNTANEAGNIGPDFRFGWGIVNGLRAGKLIEDGRYLDDEISQGENNTHTIAVPAGTAQVRFMIYWSDVEAAPNANPALVNDLDLVVTDPSNNELLPWILDPTPNPTTLNQPATTGEDHLNNMEQVLINAPEAGNYEIDVTGFNVPMGPQEYFVVYEIIEEKLTVSFPNDGEHFTPGQIETLHWDAVDLSGTTLIEYSSDNGTTWNTINSVSASTTNYDWSVPSDITGVAKIRVTNGGSTDVSDGTFSIASRVTGLTYSQVCPNEASFTWNAVTNAEEYDLYLLGDQYMEVVGTSSTETITVPIDDANNVQWAAIVARNNTEGWESLRTIAIRHAGGLLNCALANDVAITLNNTEGDFATVCSGNSNVIVSVDIQNTGVDPQSNFSISYQLDTNTPVVETYSPTITSGTIVTYDFTTPVSITDQGDYTITVSIDLTGDQNPNNDSETLAFFAVTEATALDFTESFDTNGVPPAGWSIENPDGEDTWGERTITGSDGSSTLAAYMNNYDYNAPMQEDIIKTEIFDLSNAEDVALTFDLAKAQFSSTLFDSLRVEASIDCGDTYTEIYNKTNLDLSTIASYTTTDQWTPGSANDWRTEAIDLEAFEGEVVQIRFINVNGYGNSTYLDNINLEAGLLGVSENTIGDITMYPNPANEEVFVRLSNMISASYGLTITNSLGQTLMTLNERAFTNNQASINVSALAAGMYFVTIQAGESKETKKLVIE